MQVSREEKERLPGRLGKKERTRPPPASAECSYRTRNAVVLPSCSFVAVRARRMRLAGSREIRDYEG